MQAFATEMGSPKVVAQEVAAKYTFQFMRLIISALIEKGLVRIHWVKVAIQKGFPGVQKVE